MKVTIYKKEKKKADVIFPYVGKFTYDGREDDFVVALVTGEKSGIVLYVHGRTGAYVGQSISGWTPIIEGLLPIQEIFVPTDVTLKFRNDFKKYD